MAFEASHFQNSSKMKKKLFALLFFSGLAGLFEACFCGDTLPFYDYHKLQVTYRPYPKATDSIQAFYIAPDSIEYLSSVYQTVLTTPAFGTSCPSDGDSGPKFSVTNLEIFADKDFNDTLQAGASLISLFYTFYSQDSIQSIQQNFQDFIYYEELGNIIHTPFLPSDTSQIFEITVRVTKSNGNISEGKVSGVKFK
jgi:hypothetical protein